MGATTPTMELRQRETIQHIPTGEALFGSKPSFEKRVTLVLEQKFIDPARPHAPEWIPVPIVDEHGKSIGGDSECNRSNPTTS